MILRYRTVSKVHIRFTLIFVFVDWPCTCSLIGKGEVTGLVLVLQYAQLKTTLMKLQLCLLVLFWVQQPLLGRPDHPGGGLLPRPPPMQFGGRPPMQNDMGPPGGIPSLLGPPPPMPFRMMPPGGE